MKFQKFLLSLLTAIFFLMAPLSVSAESEQTNTLAPQTTLDGLEKAKELARTNENTVVVEFKYNESQNKVTVAPMGGGFGQTLAWGTLTTSKNSTYAYADLTVTTTVFGTTISSLSGVFTWNGTTSDPELQTLYPPLPTARAQSQYPISSGKTSGVVDFWGMCMVNGVPASLDVPIVMPY